MDIDDDVIAISSGDEGGDDNEYVSRRAILEPAIRSVVEALGGYEHGQYCLGDEAYGCLKDLKKFWRKDDTDDERTVARIFWDTRVLPNDLIPILLETAGKGNVEDKRAIACADLMTAMTWPIDLAEELKELDEELDKGTDYTQLLSSHLAYKAALVTKPGVFQALLGIILPCLAKDKKTRKERDVQIVSVVLYLIRNLAFIKDLTGNANLSSDQASYATLQSKLVKTLEETHFLELFLTIASNASSDPMFNGWNTLVLEIFYLLFRGLKPESLVLDQTKQSSQTLRTLLSIESQRRQDFARSAASRHSRFGTTISVRLNPKRHTASNADANPVPDDESNSAFGLSSQSYILHRQQALGKESGSMLDLVKKSKSQKGKKVDELAGKEDDLSFSAREILRNLARLFIESCFNPFFASLLKDIKSERPKMTEKDHLRLLFVAKWFLEFFLYSRAHQAGTAEQNWSFGLIAEVTERSWIVWVLRRMREGMDEKPKAWTELQAGLDFLSQLLALIDSMVSFSASSSDSTVADVVDAAQLLQHQLIYNGEVLDFAFESLRFYKEGVQSLAFLESSVALAYALFRTLEKMGRGKEMYVIKRKAKVKRRKASGKSTEEGEGVPDVEDYDADADAEEEAIVRETLVTLETFELKFANEDITKTLLFYLARYKEFSSAENMKRVISLLHRQVVKAKAEGLFFNVSTLELFKSILAHQSSLPKDQPYKDLVNLVNYVLRRFFKAVQEEPLLIVEAFFPKNRGQWKNYSSWVPEEKSRGRKEAGVADEIQEKKEVQVKKGYEWNEQIGIAVAALVESGKKELVDWVKDILTFVIAQRKRILEDAEDREDPAEDDVDEEQRIRSKMAGPSNEALAKLQDYLIPYINDEQADAATRNAQLKLLFRLVKLFVLDEDADELEWYIPAAILPSDLQISYNVIDQYLANPIDLNGKKASQLLSKKTTRRRRRRAPSPTSSVDSDILDEEPRKKKREKKQKEEKQYKSAQFIEDSEEEYGDLEAFFEKERKLREKTALAAANGKIGTMRANGTKKRRKRNAAEDDRQRKRRRGTNAVDDVPMDVDGDVAGPSVLSDDSSSDESELDIFGSDKRRSVSTDHTSPFESASPAPAPRPRPKPRFKGRVSGSPPSSQLAASLSDDRSIDALQEDKSQVDQAQPEDAAFSDSDESHHGQQVHHANGRRGRLVLSDDDDE